MYDQPRYDVQSESSFFSDKRTMRPAVEGAVSREMETDPRLVKGRLEDNSGYVLTIPQESVASFGGMDPMLKRGKERYGIYCTPCHDGTGNGKGAVTARAQAGGAAAFLPPTFHQDRLRHMPDGQLYATVENGKSNMPPYGQMLSVHDRWAIVAYVRALQLANPRLGDEKPDDPTATVQAPAPVPAHHVEVKADRVVIDHKIHFADGSAVIEADSNDLLAEIAAVLIANPQILKMEIQGHSSAGGAADVNLRLSEARANAVRDALVQRKVPGSVVLAKGYGSSKPLVTPEATDDDKEKNRRVEFVILETKANK